jgi:thiamine-phosphate pyrophosphorylase
MSPTSPSSSSSTSDPVAAAGRPGPADAPSLESSLGADRRTRLAQARLYLVCDASPGGHELTEILHPAIAGGVQVVQLRDKTLADDELAAVAHAAHALCARLGALLIVNDRPTVARDAGADGVHVGQHDMPLGAVRELVGPDVLIGLSTHAASEIEAEDATAADYLGVGPVHETPTKPGRPAVGLELVRYAAAYLDGRDHETAGWRDANAGAQNTGARGPAKPWFAIGGLNPSNLAEVITSGAQRVAVVRAITEADDPERVARAMRQQLDVGVDVGVS